MTTPVQQNVWTSKIAYQWQRARSIAPRYWEASTIRHWALTVLDLEMVPKAGRSAVRRAVGLLGVRFADYVVVDEEFATAPFLHGMGDLHLPVVARLKGNLLELYQAAQQPVFAQPAKSRFFGKGRSGWEPGTPTSSTLAARNGLARP